MLIRRLGRQKNTSKYRKTYCRVRGEISRILELFYPSIVVIPAGIGGHIDHVTVRNVVLMLCKNTDIQIVLYEDFPYCLDENTYRLSTEFIQSLGAIPRVLSIKKYWLEKIINILEYKSQFDGDELQFLSQLFHYACQGNSSREENVSERLWIIRPNQEKGLTTE